MTTTERLTLEQFLALPETKPGTEFIAGEACQKTMPTTAHIVIQRLLSFVFTLFLREHPIGEAAWSGAACLVRRALSGDRCPTSPSWRRSILAPTAGTARITARPTWRWRSCRPMTGRAR